MNSVWTRIHVVHGPVLIDGMAFRAIEAFDAAGGHLEATESWCGHVWGRSHREESFRAVLAAVPASTAVLTQLGVPEAPFLNGYAPLANCALCCPPSPAMDAFDHHVLSDREDTLAKWGKS